MLAKVPGPKCLPSCVTNVWASVTVSVVGEIEHQAS